MRKLAPEIEEKDTQLALLNDDIIESENLVRELEFNNTGLQGEIRAKSKEIERRREENADLRERYVDHCRDPEKDNMVIITRKHTTDEEDDHSSIHTYYISRIQRCAISQKEDGLEENFQRVKRLWLLIIRTAYTSLIDSKKKIT